MERILQTKNPYCSYSSPSHSLSPMEVFSLYITQKCVHSGLHWLGLLRHKGVRINGSLEWHNSYFFVFCACFLFYSCNLLSFATVLRMCENSSKTNNHRVVTTAPILFSHDECNSMLFSFCICKQKTEVPWSSFFKEVTSATPKQNRSVTCTCFEECGAFVCSLSHTHVHKSPYR